MTPVFDTPKNQARTRHPARIATLLAMLVGLLPGAAPAGQAGPSAVGGDPARGQALFAERCSGCHALGANSYGPRLGDVYGRRAGSVNGFGYSAALQRQPLVWSAASLDHWLAGPARFLPGARMTISIGDAASRADVIAYLRSHPIGSEE